MSDAVASPLGSLFVSPGARSFSALPEHLADLFGRSASGSDRGRDVVVALASEIVEGGGRLLPVWVGTETFYLVFSDLPLPALMRLPTLLGLHKPDRRLHLTLDPEALRRLLIARLRRVPAEGIVDAYFVSGDLVLVLGDLTIRSFPRSQVPGPGHWKEDDFAAFEIDPDGSFLRWPKLDLDLGVSSLLQAVDPMYLADVEIERLAREDVGTALRELREAAGLRQEDVPGLSARQVRRLEKSTSRLTADAAEHFAEAIGVSLDQLLRDLGERTTRRNPLSSVGGGD